MASGASAADPSFGGFHGSSPPPPLILGGNQEISDQNNWGDLSKKLNLGGT